MRQIFLECSINIYDLFVLLFSSFSQITHLNAQLNNNKIRGRLCGNLKTINVFLTFRKNISS